MSFRTYLFLFILALIPPIVIAQFQPAPGYLDSDYYFAGGIQLATGKGFNEPYLWNYLDGTTSLPHPSHSYWMPLASIVSALGMWLTGQTTYASARLFFFLIAALVAPLTAYLAYKFSERRELAIISGLLAIFSIYHAPFVGVTDNFGLFMLFGGLYFVFVTQLIEDPSLIRNWFLLGLLAGLMTLSRSDGLLWLALTFLFALWKAKETKASFSQSINYLLRIAPVILLGFLIVMGPWYARNLSIFGTLMAPGGSRALWLDNYDQTFIYPPSLLSKESFLALGWNEIISDRMWALGMNLQSGFAAHGGIILFPFIVIAVIYYRKDPRVKLAAIAWLILFLVMTFIFPFAGARGAFFHAGAALQPIWWTLAPLGLEAIMAFLRKYNWGNDQGRVIFQSALVMIAIILTAFVVNLRLFDLGWGEGEENYPPVENFLIQNGIEQNDIVIVRNAPGYYLQTGRSAISVPYGGEGAILAVADQFNAYYFVMESEAAVESLKTPQDHGQFIYIGEIDDTLVYKIELE
jgi:hypothetical protein